MNRRSFFLRSASILAFFGLSAAAFSVAEGAGNFPPDLCVGLSGREREQCVARECRREVNGPLTGDPRNWQVWGYSNVKACISENS